MNEKKWKVVGDGTIRGTQIFDPEGKDISGSVRSFTVTQDASNFPSLTIEVIPAAIDITPINAEYSQYAKGSKAFDLTEARLKSLTSTLKIIAADPTSPSGNLAARALKGESFE
jgi:hypothetical protein